MSTIAVHYQEGLQQRDWKLAASYQWHLLLWLVQYLHRVPNSSKIALVLIMCLTVAPNILECLLCWILITWSGTDLFEKERWLSEKSLRCEWVTCTVLAAYHSSSMYCLEACLFARWLPSSRLPFLLLAPTLCTLLPDSHCQLDCSPWKSLTD